MAWLIIIGGGAFLFLCLLPITKREEALAREVGADQASERTQWPAGIVFTIALVGCVLAYHFLVK